MDTFGYWFPVSSDTLTSHRCIFVIKLTVYHIQYSICFYIFILVQHHIKNMQKCDTKLCLRSCVTHTLFLFLHSPHLCLHCFCSFRFFWAKYRTHENKFKTITWIQDAVLWQRHTHTHAQHMAQCAFISAFAILWCLISDFQPLCTFQKLTIRKTIII